MLEMVAVLVVMTIMASVSFPALKHAKKMLAHVKAFSQNAQKATESGKSPFEDLLEEGTGSSEKSLTRSAKRRIRKLYKRVKRKGRRSGSSRRRGRRRR